MDKKLTLKTDIWSFGLLILEAFAGEVTWNLGLTAPSALDSYLKLSALDPYPPMPYDLADMLYRCFKVDPDDRWKSMEDVSQALRNITEYNRA